MSEQQPQTLQFPPALITRSDLSRVLREIEALDNNFESQKVRSGGKTAYQIPTMSQAMGGFVEMNNLDITDDLLRDKLKVLLRKLKDTAPTVHMTFATPADPEALQQLVTWFRTQVHPLTLLSVGFQPSLVGGVYIRTPNHIHDLSFKAHLQGKRELIAKALEGLHGGQAV